MSRQGTSVRRESSKSNEGRDLRRLEDIPNVGPAIAAVRFMEGGPKKPWWKYTAERKRELAARDAGRLENL